MHWGGQGRGAGTPDVPLAGTGHAGPATRTSRTTGVTERRPLVSRPGPPPRARASGQAACRTDAQRLVISRCRVSLNFGEASLRGSGVSRAVSSVSPEGSAPLARQLTASQGGPAPHSGWPCAGKRTHVHMHAHTCIHVCTHSYTCIHVCTHTHAGIYMHAHAHTHEHKHNHV